MMNLTMYRTKESADEIWAVVDKDNNVCYSRGGSSTDPRLMVYNTEAGAKKALNSCWTKQVIDVESVSVKCIYKSVKGS